MAAKVVTVERLTGEHVKYIAANCRDADRQEIRLSVGVGPLLALEISHLSSAASWVGLADGVPVAAFGVSYKSFLDRSTGVPWLVGTHEIEKNQMAFLRRNKPYIERMTKAFSLLENHVWVENTIAIRWLEWMGFDIDSPKRYGIANAMFHKFSKVGKNVH